MCFLQGELLSQGEGLGHQNMNKENSAWLQAVKLPQLSQPNLFVLLIYTPNCLFHIFTHMPSGHLKYSLSKMSFLFSTRSLPCSVTSAATSQLLKGEGWWPSFCLWLHSYLFFHLQTLPYLSPEYTSYLLSSFHLHCCSLFQPAVSWMLSHAPTGLPMHTLASLQSICLHSTVINDSMSPPVWTL